MNQPVRFLPALWLQNLTVPITAMPNRNLLGLQMGDLGLYLLKNFFLFNCRPEQCIDYRHFRKKLRRKSLSSHQRKIKSQFPAVGPARSSTSLCFEQCLCEQLNMTDDIILYLQLYFQKCHLYQSASSKSIRGPSLLLKLKHSFWKCFFLFSQLVSKAFYGLAPRWCSWLPSLTPPATYSCHCQLARCPTVSYSSSGLQ